MRPDPSHSVGTATASVARPSHQPRLSDAEFREARRTQREPLADAIRRRALCDFLDAESWQELETRIAHHGLRLEPAQRGGGVVVWTDDDERVSISKIDRRLSGPKLAKRFGETFKEHRVRIPEPPTVDEVLPIRRLEVASVDERADEVIRQLEAERPPFTEQAIRRRVKWQHDQADVVATVLADRRVERIGTDDAGRPLFSTVGHQRAETELHDAANALGTRASARLNPKLVRPMVAERFAELGIPTRDAIVDANCEKDLGFVDSRVVSDKTGMAKAMAEAYKRKGYNVRVATLGAGEAARLRDATGIDCRTLASRRRRWAQGKNLPGAKTVLLVDEADRFDTHALAEALAIVERAGGKVVLVGDPDVDGTAFAGLFNRVHGTRAPKPTVEATEAPRPVEAKPAPRIDSPALRRLDALLRDDGVEVRDDAIDRVVDAYLSAPAADDRPLILTQRQANADALNAAIRERMELGLPIELAGKTFAEGDRVVFTASELKGLVVRTVDGEVRPEKGRGVRAGALGTLESIDDSDIRIRLDDGRLVALDPKLYAELDHGYALTTSRANGTRAEDVVVLAEPAMDEVDGLVALSSHRRTVRVVASAGDFPGGVGQLAEVLARAPVDRKPEETRPRFRLPRSSVPTFERHPILRRRVELTGPTTRDPVAATRAAVDKLRAFDKADTRLWIIERAREKLLFGGKTQAVADALAMTRTPEPGLRREFKESSHLDKEARRWFADLDGTRGDRVEAVLDASKDLSPTDFAKLPAADRALVRDLWGVSLAPIERAAEDFQHAEQEMLDEHPGLRDEQAQHQFFTQLATEAALAIAPRPIRRVVGIALTLARLYRDTPRALLHLVGPRPVREIEKAVRLATAVTGKAIEPKTPAPKPTYTRPPTAPVHVGKARRPLVKPIVVEPVEKPPAKPVEADPIQRLATALRSGDSSAISTALQAAEDVERRKMQSSHPALSRAERDDLRTILRRLDKAIDLDLKLQALRVPQREIGHFPSAEVQDQLERHAFLRQDIEKEGLQPDRVLGELNNFLRGRTFDADRVLPRRYADWKFYDEVRAILDRLQEAQDRDLPRFSALWSAAQKVGMSVSYERFGLDEKRLRHLQKLAPTRTVDKARQVLRGLVAKHQQRQHGRDRGGWEL